MHAVVIRTMLRPGEVSAIVRTHGSIYAREFGFDATFEDCVAGPLVDFAQKSSTRERIWVAEREDRIVGSAAIVAASGYGSAILRTVGALSAAARLYRATGFRRLEEKHEMDLRAP